MPISSSSTTTLTAIAVALFGFACGSDTTASPAPVTSGGQGGNAATGGAGGDGGTQVNASVGGSTSDGGAGGGEIPEPLCGDGKVAPGELCLGGSTSYSSTKRILEDLVVFDCDGDLDLDVVALAEGDSAIVALINDGIGQFSDVEISSALNGATALAAGQIDGEEGIDIVAVYAGSGVNKSFMQSNAKQGTPCGFDSQDPIPIDGAGTDVALIDINDDGALDFVGTVNSSPDNISFWVNLPNNAANSIPDTGAVPTAIVVGDVDGDMKDDIVYVARTPDKIHWRSGTGSGFGAVVEAPLDGKIGNGPNDLVLGDLDGDGDNDVVVVNDLEETIGVLLNSDGLGLFTPILTNVDVATDDVDPMRIAIGDMDNDGDLDVVTANRKYSASQESSVSVLLNDGAGLFELATINNTQGVLVNVSSPMETGRQPVSLALADVNGDGALDIITGSDYVSGGVSQLSVILSAP